MRTASGACWHVEIALQPLFSVQRLRLDCAIRNCTVYYFEIARDRVTGTIMYNGPNVFLCSFYDVYVICHAKNRACKRVTANHKVHYFA